MLSGSPFHGKLITNPTKEKEVCFKDFFFCLFACNLFTLLLIVFFEIIEEKS